MKGGIKGLASSWKQLWTCLQFDVEKPLASCGLGNPSIGHGKKNLDVVSDPAGSGLNVLRILYPKGSYIRNGKEFGGAGWKGRHFGELDSGYLEYDIMFSKNFNFVLGGKLPGFYGGKGACVGGHTKPNCFSTRFMWRKNGDGEVYVYIDPDNGDWFCGHRDIVCNFAYGHSFGRGTFKFSPGIWQRLGQFLKLNTPGKKDGVIRLEFNGRKVFELGGLIFRKDYSVKIDALYFNTFFGGSTDDWASTADVYTYYKNFTLSNPHK